MPGSNHQMESGFLDELPHSLRPAAADLLQNYRLKQLIEMRKEGPYPELAKRFHLKTPQWFQVLDAVLLSKISYFELSSNMRADHIRLLMKTIALATNEPDITLTDLLKKTEKRYTFFSDWIRKFIEINRSKILTAKKRLKEDSAE
ncbi:MAG: hypothetical protein R3219_02520 [Hydrogenovibrio sp.]|nr:hypothetical protein [Hydrogenovibrio sp.]